VVKVVKVVTIFFGWDKHSRDADDKGFGRGGSGWFQKEGLHCFSPSARFQHYQGPKQQDQQAFSFDHLHLSFFLFPFFLFFSLFFFSFSLFLDKIGDLVPS